MFSITNDDCYAALDEPSLFKRDSSSIFSDHPFRDALNELPQVPDESLTFLFDAPLLDIFEDLDNKPLLFEPMEMPPDTPMEGTTVAHNQDSQSSNDPAPDSQSTSEGQTAIPIDALVQSAKTFVPPAVVAKAPKRKNKKKDPTRTWDNF